MFFLLVWARAPSVGTSDGARERERDSFSKGLPADLDGFCPQKTPSVAAGRDEFFRALHRLVPPAAVPASTRTGLGT